MKKRQMIVGIAAVLVFVSLFAMPAHAASDSSVSSSEKVLSAKYNWASIIRINSDDEFVVTAYFMHWTGNGSADNPYIIPNYEIDANGSGSGIYIGNVTLSFVIENCFIHNTSYISSPYFRGAGIELYNVSSAYMKIQQNILANNSYGVYVEGVHGLYIEHNEIRNNSNAGIYLYSETGLSTYYIWIKYNNVTNNYAGIVGSNVYVSNIEQNNCTYNGHQGISIGGTPASDNLIYKNNCSSNGEDGIQISGSITNMADGNTVEYNTVYNNTEGIHVSYASNTTIIFNDVYNNSKDGIYLDSLTQNSNVSGNHIFNNTQNGIYIYQISSSLPTMYNDFSKNNISFNNEGIYSFRASHSTIFNNIFYANAIYGVSLYSSDYNVVYNNSFYRNHNSSSTYNASRIQAADSGLHNLWNTTVGNFWYDWQTPDNDHDGFVDVPYSIDGSAGSSDYLPLATDYNVPEFSPLFVILALFVTMAIALKKKQ